MIIDFRQLEQHSGRLSSNEVITFEDPFDRETAIECRIEVEYQRSGSAYYLHGEVRGGFQTQCHRCLDDVKQELSGDFDVVVRRGAGDEAPDPEETNKDYILLSLNQHEVSLDEYVYESLIVNIPMQIVCKEDCRGLCPSCGINRNRESCTCEAAADPRWDALRKLGKKPAE